MTVWGSRRGYDSLDINEGILLDLQFREGTGTVTTQDWSKPHHPMTLVDAPAWATLASGLTVLDFSGSDEIICGDLGTLGYWITDRIMFQVRALKSGNTGDFESWLWDRQYWEDYAGRTPIGADLDFTTEDFSLVIWAYHRDADINVLMNRAILDHCGWEYYTWGGNLAIRTNQAGDREGASAVGFVEQDTWQCLGFVRQGLHGQMYINGEPVVTLQTVAGLVDPVACGTTLFRVGNNPHNDLFNGQLWRPRVWNRQVSVNEMSRLFEEERRFFGV